MSEPTTGDDASSDDVQKKREILQQREKAIQQLLIICEEAEVEIPEDLIEKLKSSPSLTDKDDDEASKRRRGRQGSSLDRSVLEDSIDDARRVAEEFDGGVLAQEIMRVVRSIRTEFPSWDLRVKDGNYTITGRSLKHESAPQEDDEECAKDGNDVKLPAVIDMNFATQVWTSMKTVMQTGKLPRFVERDLVLLNGINLKFESGKMYLVLGAPGAGKSTLLKAISGVLREDKNHVMRGNFAINGVSSDTKEYHWENLVSYVDQIDRHHEVLTVQETLDYAWFCRQGGTHYKYGINDQDAEVKKTIEELDKEHWVVKMIMEGLGLTRVKDTFVGDDVKVRGVSGGERKRVTLAEIIAFGAPIMCLDEISTGLDAATTYDITKLMSNLGRANNTIRIVSLLQPPPETVAIFDELILIDKGQVLYSGPVSDVVTYFEGLGYALPERMDIADWLQSLPTPDGARFVAESMEQGTATPRRHLTQAEFVEAFRESLRGKTLSQSLEAPLQDGATSVPVDPQYTKKFRNSVFKALILVIKHEFLVWRRNVFQIKARLSQCLLMAVIVGTVFWQVTDEPSSMVGVMYQSLFFISLGGLSHVMRQIDSRGVFYKHKDANLYPTWVFVLGRSIATFPSSLLDMISYGVIVFFCTGMAYTDGASIGNFFMFLLLVLMSAYCTTLTYSVLSALMPDRSAAMSVAVSVLIMMVIFSGFTVQPDVIPAYWIWAYYANYFAWMLRSVMVNQYRSGRYDTIVDPETGVTEGERVLLQFGFTTNGEAYGFEWVWYGVAFVTGMCFISMIANTISLIRVRYHTGQTLTSQAGEEEDALSEVQTDNDGDDLPFKKVRLTFKDMRYTVKMSTSKDTIDLLKGIDGYFEPGKMTALMGSSGAGKTTLMDVLALRKSSGTVSGEVMLNGHIQEANSFRRCTGYVEQFDTQSEQLTVRETVEFSAKMRIDRSCGDVSAEKIIGFVNKTLQMLELSSIENFLVGSDLRGGLSFEQRKRLSIAVELASNPSIIFLDEPTSGLDARAAAIVMRGLKRIADSGRAICATIHQPSVAIFNSFDSLLLLKRGGETVYFGELGSESCSLINYLEQYDSTPPIRPGENPATWMLTTIGSGTGKNENDMDYAKAYSKSKLHSQALHTIREYNADAKQEDRIEYLTKYATNAWYQSQKVFIRAMKVYWRSPSYNRSRLIVSAVIALLFGSVFASQRIPHNESEMNSRITSIYISALFLGTAAYITVLPFFEKERNMFYRHKAALMYDQSSLTLSYTLAEIPFILLSGLLFNICFYFLLGFRADAGSFFLFYFFTIMNMSIWTYLGQTSISLFRDAVTANGFGSVLIGLSSIFAGILIRPQNIQPFWLFMYWTLPLHYVLEGLTVSQFSDYDQPIEATPGSPFHSYLVASGQCDDGQVDPCFGRGDEWFYVAFDGWWRWEHLPWNSLYLICCVVVVKLVGYVAIWQLNYLSK